MSTRPDFIKAIPVALVKMLKRIKTLYGMYPVRVQFSLLQLGVVNC